VLDFPTLMLAVFYDFYRRKRIDLYFYVLYKPSWLDVSHRD
jgi:hypothetical protein